MQVLLVSTACCAMFLLISLLLLSPVFPIDLLCRVLWGQKRACRFSDPVIASALASFPSTTHGALRFLAHTSPFLAACVFWWCCMSPPCSTTRFDYIPSCHRARCLDEKRWDGISNEFLRILQPASSVDGTNWHIWNCFTDKIHHNIYRVRERGGNF